MYRPVLRRPMPGTGLLARAGHRRVEPFGAWLGSGPLGRVTLRYTAAPMARGAGILSERTVG